VPNVDAEEEVQRSHVLHCKLGTEGVDDLLQQFGARRGEHHVVDVEEQVDDVAAAAQDEEEGVRPCGCEPQLDGMSREAGESGERCLS
jgi:hypothetical protein